MKKIILGLSLFFIFASSITAQRDRQENPLDQNSRRKPPPISELFKQMDVNKDEKLSKAEVKGPLENDFAKIDGNKDGFLTKVELEKMPPPPKERQGQPR